MDFVHVVTGAHLSLYRSETPQTLTKHLLLVTQAQFLQVIIYFLGQLVDFRHRTHEDDQKHCEYETHESQAQR